MKIYKEKQYLVFERDDGKVAKYDFATKQAIGFSGKPVKSLQNQLNGLTIEELVECCTDKQYAKFLKFIMKSQIYSISNIGTVLKKVPEYARFEQIFSAGIEDIIDYRESFKYQINDIPKSLVKLCRKYKVRLSNNIIQFYKEKPDAYQIAYNLEYISLTPENIFTIWKTEHVNYVNCLRETSSYFNDLIDKFGYNAKNLWLYLDRIKTFEAIDDMSFLLRELYDYANMMNQLSPKFDKYPRHFLTTHKIACRNYNRMKKEFSEELFKKRINKQYECSFGDYIFIYPESTQDIKDEAVQMSNCVSSYIDKVIDGQCHILFLRKKNKPDESLVTIEVRNDKIVQARRRFNDPVTAEEQEIIDKFNNKFSKRKEDVA